MAYSNEWVSTSQFLLSSTSFFKQLARTLNWSKSTRRILCNSGTLVLFETQPCPLRYIYTLPSRNIPYLTIREKVGATKIPKPQVNWLLEKMLWPVFNVFLWPFSVFQHKSSFSRSGVVFTVIYNNSRSIVFQTKDCCI